MRTPALLRRRGVTVTVGTTLGGVAVLSGRAQQRRRDAWRAFSVLPQYDYDSLIGMTTATLLTRREAVEAARLSVAYAPGALVDALRSLVLARRPFENATETKAAFFAACRAEIGPAFPLAGSYLPGRALKASKTQAQPKQAAAVIVPAQPGVKEAPDAQIGKIKKRRTVPRAA